MVEQQLPSEAGPRTTPQTKSSSAWGSHDAIEWVGVLRYGDGTAAVDLVIAIRETTSTTLYRVLHGPSDLDYASALRKYFQLDVPLSDLYKEWSVADPVRLKRIAKAIPGVRMIDQDPWECLISFICSSNNNIPRIAKMLASIRRNFGQPLLTIGETTLNSFPSFQELKDKATDEILRDACGMGYRSKYIITTMEILDKLGGEQYLHDLRKDDDPLEVQSKLCQFCGVGPKVADCVALFSLRQVNAIPVDVHVWNIARRDYDSEGALFSEVKSITPKVYKQVGDLFRSRFSQKAGWAHSLLFVAELPSFRAVLPDDIVAEMDQFRELEQERKAAMKSPAKKGRKSPAK